jgi:nitronate monooxygenase
LVESAGARPIEEPAKAGAALQGDAQRGLFSRGVGRLPFGSEIRPVHDLIFWLLTSRLPADLAEVEVAAQV